MPMDIRIGKTFEVETINGFKVLLTRPEEPEAEPASWSETPKSFGCLAHFGKMIQRCIPFLGRANKKKKKRGNYVFILLSWVNTYLVIMPEAEHSWTGSLETVTESE